MKESFKSTIAALPEKPGVYRYYAQDGTLLYIGKAKNLKKRVASYFQDSKAKNQRTMLMISQIDRIEYTVVGSERESLILEANLIHNLQPKYNVLLKDDKNYLYVRITDDPIPNVVLTRRKFDPKSRYYGPYTRKYGIAETLRTLRAIFPYCEYKKSVNRPCSYVHIRQCDGICYGKESRNDCIEKINNIEKVLCGHTDEVRDWLHNRIKHAVDQGNFELAWLWKERLKNLEATVGTQKIILPHPQDIDLVTLALEQDTDGTAIGSVFLQSIRDGKLINVANFLLTGTDDIYDREEDKNADIKSFIIRFLSSYMSFNFDKVPILLNTYRSHFISDKTESDSALVFKRVTLTKTEKNDIEIASGCDILLKNTQKLNHHEIAILIQQGFDNAVEYLNRNRSGHKLSLFEENNLYITLTHLQSELGLTKVPRRIECYDVSHLSGTFVYGSMITFLDGRPTKKWYKLFKLRDQNNDVENMAEMISRRLKRFYKSHTENDHEPNRTQWALPDLIMIDGGVGQLNAVLSVFSLFKDEMVSQNICFEVELCALAKREELLFRPGSDEPIRLSENTRFLIQRIRDEAHRFAITNNRNARLKTATKSRLDTIKGIGPKTKQRILREFGSVDGLVQALDQQYELVHEKLGASTTALLVKELDIPLRTIHPNTTCTN